VLFRPKKINKGFDRIFLVLAIMAGLSVGFYVGLDGANSKLESESIKDFLPFVSPFPGVDASKELLKDWLKEEKAIEKALPLAHERLREKKRQLESQGYRVSFANYYGRGKHKEYYETDDPNAPEIWVYPSISNCIAWGAALGAIIFLIVFLSLRGIALVVFWIKQGFSDNNGAV
jgi:hypothetical protein